MRKSTVTFFILALVALIGGIATLAYGMGTNKSGSPSAGPSGVVTVVPAPSPAPTDAVSEYYAQVHHQVPTATDEQAKTQAEIMCLAESYTQRRLLLDLPPHDATEAERTLRKIAGSPYGIKAFCPDKYDALFDSNN